MSPNDSIKIRRQLGFYKKQIQRLCSTATLTAKEYDVNARQPNFESLDDDEIEAFRLEVTTVRHNLLKAYSQITKLHDEWVLLQETDPAEVQQFNNYISKYGDYRNTITEAVAKLEEMDLLLSATDKECHRRHLSISSASSAVTIPDENGQRHQATAAIAPTAAQASSSQLQGPSNSLLNFVDASILTKLELPTFDGNLLEYPEFASRFATLVGNKTQLDNTTKLSLLKSCLRGRALQSIQGLSMTPENFAVAMDILRTHYDDKVTMRHILYTKLAQLPDCDPEGRNLQTLYNRMFALVRQFANSNDDSSEEALGAILLNKLPARVKSRIYDMTTHSHNLSPSELLRLLTDIVRKESVLFEMDYHSKSNQTPHSQHHGFHVIANPKNQRQLQAVRSRQKLKLCPYCSRNHLPIFCDSFVTPQLRSRRAKELRMCLNCLSNQHLIKDCRSKRTCKFCNKRHHTSLCFSQSRSPQQNKSAGERYAATRTSHPRRVQSFQQAANVAETISEVTINPSASVSTNADVAITACTSIAPTKPKSPTPTSLMCTPVRLFNPSSPSLEVTVAAFLDSGSSQSYITEELAELLHLPPLSTEDISISTFGTITPLQMKSSNHVIGERYAATRTSHPRRVQSFQQAANVAETISEVTINPSASVSTNADVAITACTSIAPTKPKSPTPTSLMCTPVRLFNPSSPSLEVTVAAFLDSGSSQSYITEELAELLHLPPLSTEDISISTFGTITPLQMKSSNHVIGILMKNGEKHLNVKSVPTLTGHLRHIHHVENTKNGEAVTSTCKPSILIGNDYFWDMVLSDKFYYEILPNGYRLLHTNLGKIFVGKGIQLRNIASYSSLLNDDIANPAYHDELSRLVTNFWELEAVGILDNPAQKDDETCLQFFNNTITYDNKDKRYVVKLPFKTDPRQLPDNFALAFSRFSSLVNSLKNKPSYMKKYDDIIKDQLQKKIIEEVPPSEISKSSHYLSHHGVITTENDDIKIRCVFDGSAKTKGHQSINEMLYRGPVLLPDLAELNKFFETEENEKVPEIQKLLGIHWHLSKDKLSIKLPRKPPNDGIWTKRKILKEVASIYDPLGFLTPFTLIGKLFLQSLWKDDIGWDDALNKEQTNQWQLIINQWTTSSLQLDRQIVNIEMLPTSSFDLHVFTDASGRAYCAVAYLVQRCQKKPNKVSLLMAKSRLAPLHQTITIPRLELSAIAVGAKLLTFLTQQLDLQLRQKYLWTDSTVALTWTKTNKTLPVFVRNRVRTIRELTTDVVIRYVPTKDNPADIGCRGATIAELQNLPQWWNGPTFLTQDEARWPPLSPSEENPISQEQDEPQIISSAALQHSLHRSSLVDSSRFSTWTSLLDAMIFVLRFIVTKSTKAASFFGRSRALLRVRAERILFRVAQQEDPPSVELQKQLNLFYCEETQLWKSQGRIDNAPLPREAKTPVFLPAKNHVTDLFVLHVHSQNNHCGVNHTLTEIRQQVWIPKGRTTVKRILRSICFYCKKFTSKPYQLPPFPPHPIRRVTPPSYPFQNVGMDFFGPMLYRTPDNTTEKYWTLLLTCLNTRAVYVDVVLNMSSHAVLHVLRRFIATVGCPSWILCDNAQSFKAVAECYSTFPEGHMDNDIIDYCSKKRIQIKFIPSLSPWQGGIYEKMVDVFKKSFKHSVRNRLLHMEDVKTLMKEAEAIVNTRPLTYVDDEINYFPLRPIDFLRPHARLAGPYPQEDDFERSVQVRLPSKKVITRPHNLVYKLEIQPEESTLSPPQPTSKPSTHPMITRSKTRLQSASMFVTLLMCIQVVGAINTRCPDEMNTKKVILYATTCVSQGIAIARYNESNKEKFCWFPLTCPQGAIRFEGPGKPNLALCGERCRCPSWSQSCSFTKNWRTSMSTTNSIPEHIQNYRPPYVCSFTKSSTCDSTKKIGVFNQIQLFDNSTFIVETLTLSIQDYIDENDFICVDRKGWIRRKTRRITGTSRFCETHTCRNDAQLFCTYDSPIAIFVSNNAPSHNIPPITVKAWGTITKTYYGYPSKNTTRWNESSVQASIHTQCSKGGLTITSNTSLQLVELCVTSYCVFLKEVTSQQVLFPNILIMYAYEVRLKVWNYNNVIHEKHVKCEAHPICETLQCLLCWEWIYNTQCWTYRQRAYLIIFFILTVLITPPLCLLLKLLIRTSYLMIRSLRYFIKCAWKRKKHKEANFRRYTIRRRHNSQKKLFTCTIMIVLHIQLSKECSQFTSITADEQICTITNDTRNCVFNQATIITLQPLQQEACLELQDYQSQHLGTIIITLLEIQYQCHKRIEFFSRDHEIASESSHRCFMTDSCSKNACDNIKTTDTLKEFSSTANNNPGFTYCTPTCGCLLCSGCFLCHPSCLFHRIYAKPTSSSIYTIFNCPTWDLTAIAKITLTQGTSTTSTQISLTPGHTIVWNDLRLTLIGSITPQLPILSSTFMETSDNIAIVKSVHKGQLIPHTAGQLQCATLQDAKDFRCLFASESCKCANGFLKVSCSCPDGNMKRLMEPSPLPQAGKNFLIVHNNGHIFAKLNIGSALQLHIVMENLKLIAQQHKSSCIFQTSDLTGCYSCIPGAIMDLACTSDEGEVTALITCEDQYQIAKCTPRTKLNKLVFHFSTSHVYTSCSASCPGGSANITIKGTLAYVDDNLISRGSSVASERRTASSDTSLYARIVTKFTTLLSDITHSVQSFFLSLVTVKNVLLLFVVLLILNLISCAYRTIFHTVILSKKIH
ncbi:Pao retrotransposon peptidase [Ostertagia ostertagi]